MRAGFAKYDLTPPMGVELSGYGYYLHRCAESVQDNLYARALILEDDQGKRAALVSCELLGLNRAVCADVMAHARTLGIAPEACLIVSVHTHTGPCVQYHEGCGYPDPAYVAAVAGRISRALDGAAADLDEVSTLSSACVPTEHDYIYNRAPAGGPVDRFVRGFILRRVHGKPIAAVSAACHGVFRGRSTAVSADLSGEINRLMEEKGFDSLYLNGLCGDIDPYKPSDERLRAFSLLVTDAFLAHQQPLPLRLSGGVFPYSLRLTLLSEQEIREAAAGAVARAGGEDRPAARVALIWRDEMLARIDSLSDTEEISCKYLILGGVPVIAFPLEGFTLIGDTIREILGRANVVTLGCAEELFGYLPTKTDIEHRSYAAFDSTFLYKRLPIVPGEAERLGEEAGRHLKALPELQA